MDFIIIDLLYLFKPLRKSYNDTGFSISKSIIKLSVKKQLKLKLISLCRSSFNKIVFCLTLFKNKFILMGFL